MTISKPYRICNPPAKGKTILETCHPDCTTVFLKEGKEQYELRIHLVATKKQTYAISICDGILYLISNAAKEVRKRDLITRFPLFANIQQNKIQAFYRPYGIKVLMPKVPSDGIVVIIPIN